jgi:hypothetical protein
MKQFPVVPTVIPKGRSGQYSTLSREQHFFSQGHYFHSQEHYFPSTEVFTNKKVLP